MSFFTKKYGLERAAADGDLDTLKMYLTDPGFSSVNVAEALRFACMYGHNDVVKYILTDRRLHDSYIHCLAEACDYGHLDIVHTLLDDSRTVISEFALYRAIGEQYGSVGGHTEIVRLLLSHPRWTAEFSGQRAIDVETRAIVLAAEDGHTKIVQFLLKRGIGDPSHFDCKPLYMAVHRGHIKVVQTLLTDSRVDPSTNGTNVPINFAAENNDLVAVYLLIKDPRVQAAPMSEKARSLILPAFNGAAKYRRSYAVSAWYALRAARRARRAAAIASA